MAFTAFIYSRDMKEHVFDIKFLIQKKKEKRFKICNVIRDRKYKNCLHYWCNLTKLTEMSSPLGGLD